MDSPLKNLGWNTDLETIWNDGNYDAYIPGRIIADYGQNYKVGTPSEITAELSGRMDYLADPDDIPKIGDWVAVQIGDDNHGIIHKILPRKSEISRKQPGNKYQRQVLAANIDSAFLVQALDADFSPERLRRYIFQLQKDGITPIIILNKSDKVDDLAPFLNDLEGFDIKIIVASALENDGIENIIDAMEAYKTTVILGSSGVGKSTITNLLIGEERQATRSIREDDSKGRHTTTHRELFILPNGSLLIDTPGLRELQLWGDQSDLAMTFPHIESLSLKCKYNNCSHTVEAGCAVLDAVKKGELEESELEAYFRFQKELEFLNTKVDVKAADEHKNRNKSMQKKYRLMKKAREQQFDD